MFKCLSVFFKNQPRLNKRSWEYTKHDITFRCSVNCCRKSWRLALSRFDKIAWKLAKAGVKIFFISSSRLIVEVIVPATCIILFSKSDLMCLCSSLTFHFRFQGTKAITKSVTWNCSNYMRLWTRLSSASWSQNGTSLRSSDGRVKRWNDVFVSL